MLQCFQLLSGLRINFQKSSLFGFNESQETIQYCASILGCNVENGAFKYLGNIICSNPAKSAYWNHLLSKVKNKLDNWHAENHSITGKLILMKATLDSIPIFWFNLFLVPGKVLNELEKLRRRFLWGASTDGSNKPHSISWEKVCVPKEEGGLGITSLKIRNWSLVAKWVWRAHSERGRLWN